MKFRVISSLLLFAAVVPMPAGQAFAKNAPGVPAATLSQAGAGGGAPVSDGVTPESGGVEGGFEYGGEAGVGTKTTVIDFELPAGISLASDPNCDFGFGELCIIMETDCDVSTKDGTGVIAASGNKISFRLACDIGESFFFEAGVDSLAPFGDYATSFQFKTTTLKRGANNMWQIKLPETFFVGDN